MLRIIGLSRVRTLTFLLAFVVSVPFGGACAQSFRVLYSFTGGSDGAMPSAPLIADSVGNLYGTTVGGSGCGGTVFKLTPNGTQEVLHCFNGSDGSEPFAGVTADSAGNLYGTTYAPPGTVYKLAPNGTMTVLHTFSFENGDGIMPFFAGVVADKAGNLYGTTLMFGANSQGTVFKVAPDGTETIVYSFKAGADGASPWGGLIEKAGKFYGTTAQGGGTGCWQSFGCGTIFRVAPNGDESVLYAFKGGSDGAWPIAGLIKDEAGNFYGTTEEGGGTGCSDGLGCGTVFKLAPNGVETVLYAFTGASDGANPYGGVVRDGQGNLYGTTYAGGAGCSGSGCGVVFEVSPNGVETVLYTFTGGSDGANPTAGLMKDGHGNLYGTASSGGQSGCESYGCGTVFTLRK